MAKRLYSSIEEEIDFINKDRAAVIFTHNYQSMDVQRGADYVGDSLYLARTAEKLREKIVVFAEAYFMAANRVRRSIECIIAIS